MDPAYAALRRMMVAGQIRARGVRQEKVLSAMEAVERHLFVPEGERAMAYEDTPLPIGEGQTISQPYMVALMTESLLLTGGETVLEVGTGSGYQAAILAEMGCVVHTLERNAILAERARKLLEKLGYDRIEVHLGDGTLGLPEKGPFQAILVTAGGPGVPLSLKEQLDPEGGRLSIPVGDRYTQTLLRITRKGDLYRTEDLGGCRFVPLIGAEGWPG